MFRIALIIAALVSGHHKVHVTQADGKGYMTTSLACPVPLGSNAGAGRKIICVNGHLVLKARISRAHPAFGQTGTTVTTRRASVYNAAGRLVGWVDWTSGAHAIGHVLTRNGPSEAWQEGR